MVGMKILSSRQKKVFVIFKRVFFIAKRLRGTDWRKISQCHRNNPKPFL
jgi:hypothetical protein